MKSNKAFVLWRRRLSYMIWYRDCIHIHHHTEIQDGFELEQKSHQHRSCTMLHLLYRSYTCRSPSEAFCLTTIWKQAETMKETVADWDS